MLHSACMPTGTIDRDDHDLAVRFRDGDPDAIREVYRLYSGSMYALSRSLVAERGHAKDAVQQTGLHAWRGGARLRARRCGGLGFAGGPRRPAARWSTTKRR